MSADAVTFDRTDEALPMPVQKDWLTLLPYVNELKDLNYYGLTVKGLPKGDTTASRSTGTRSAKCARRGTGKRA